MYDNDSLFFFVHLLCVPAETLHLKSAELLVSCKVSVISKTDILVICRAAASGVWQQVRMNLTW